jgi:hypothetical protein
MCVIAPTRPGIRSMLTPFEEDVMDVNKKIVAVRRWEVV